MKTLPSDSGTTRQSQIVEFLDQSINNPESMVISAIISFPEAIIKAVDTGLRPQDFEEKRCQEIYQAAQAVYEEGLHVDMMSLHKMLAKQKASATAVDLADFTFNQGLNNIDYNCMLIRERALKRSTRLMASRLYSIANDEGNDIFDLITKSADYWDKLTEGFDMGSAKVIDDLMGDHLKHVEMVHRGEVPGGILTGWEMFDRMTGGLQPRLYILAGRPAMGKTTVATEKARRLSKSGTPGAMFSLEMPASELLNKIIGGDSRINTQFVERGKLKKDELSKYVVSGQGIAATPLYIDDTASMDIQQFRVAVRQLVKQKGIKWVILDYLQLLTVKGVTDKQLATSIISRTLKLISKENNIPVIALSQLSRAVETRGGDKRPMLSDLRDSGTIEQDADTVIFVYRPEYYEIKGEMGEDFANQLFLIIAKQRGGSTGDIKMFADLKTSFVEDWETYQAQSMYREPTEDGNLVPLSSIQKEYDNGSPF